MSVICPTITAYNYSAYSDQLNAIRPFAKRIHVDIMDGKFTEITSVSANEINWPPTIEADVHLMCQNPDQYFDHLIELKPRTVIWPFEIDVKHNELVDKLHGSGIKAGLAILQQTSVLSIEQLIFIFDHVLIFSGHLGYHGGTADLGLLDKVKHVREVRSDVEIGWDGGVNDQNAKQLSDSGVDVLNVGGYIQKDPDPEAAYGRIMERLN